MSSNGYGTVTHVDFTPINKKPGFDEDYESELMSAFVHFMDPVHCADGKYYWMGGKPLGDFWTTISKGKSYKLQLTKDEYWICLKNKNPIKRTRMNIHQVVENGRHLETFITTQAAEIKNLTETVDNLSEKLEGMHDVIYQLIGGLYCQRTQSRMIGMHLYHLGFEEYKNATNKCDTHPSGIWPTTRQCDENRERIEQLEKKLKSLEEE
jgi:polyhydroxyalkanoate synthesis regulator phasin